MSTVTMLPSGRFRGFARVRGMKDAQVFDHRPDAKLWADKTEGRMRKGTWMPPEREPVAPLPLYTIKDAVEHYVESEQWLQLAQTTRTADKPRHPHLIRELGHIELKALTADDVRAYIAKRRKAKPARINPLTPDATLSNSQLRLEVAALSAVLNCAIEEKRILDNVTRAVKRPKSDRRTGRFTDEQIGKFFTAPAIFDDEKAYAFFIVLFSTGCRPGELSHAEKSWLRPYPPQLVLPRTKNEDPRVIVLGKGLYNMLAQEAAQTPDSCKYIFPTKRRAPATGWTWYNYRTPWDSGAKHAGLTGTDIVAYTARHEVVSKLFESTDLSDGAIAGITGHRSAAALWNYRHLRNELQRPMMGALNSIVTDAINREISGLAPGRRLGIGERLLERDEALKAEFNPPTPPVV